MYVDSIQYNNHNKPNFGAKLVFADKDAEKLLHNTLNKEFCKNVLDRFEHYMPEHTVEISIKKVRPIAQDWLFAKNLKTGYSDVKGHTSAERIYPMEYENGCDSLYSLLNNLLDKKLSWHNSFWVIKNK